MKKVLYTIALILAFFLGNLQMAQSQVIIGFLPYKAQNTVSGLYEITINNLDNTIYQGAVAMVLQDEQGRTVMEISNKKVNIGKGNNTYNFRSLPGTSTKPGHASYADLISASGRLPNGSYTYCISVALSDDKNDFIKEQENCFDFDVLQISELNLIYPDDKENICETNPLLRWQPLFPYIDGVSYTIRLVEIKNNQSPGQAINNNMPLLFREQVNQTNIQAAQMGQSLVTGKSYAWQVFAIKSNVQVATSELWSFKVGCEDSIKANEQNSYILLSALNSGVDYLAKGGIVPIAFFNPYAEQPLRYSITDMTDPENKIRQLPAIKMATGLNKIQIDFEELGGAIKGHYYLLSFKGIAESTITVKAKYE